VRIFKNIGKVLAGTLLFAVLAASLASAGTPVIIVHKDNPISSISKSDIARIFLGKKKSWESGSRITPGLMKSSNDTMKVFMKDYCNKSPKRFNAHWMRHVFSGSGQRPEEFSSSIQAIQYISTNRNGIAVIDSSKLPRGVKRLKITE